MNVLRGKHLYMSGPIEHDDKSVDWRAGPTKTFTQSFGIEVFDPNSDPKQRWVPMLNKAREECDFNEMARIAKLFVRKDLQIVQRTDIVVAYLPRGVVTTGTHHEIINSWGYKNPTLLVCPQGKQFVPAWYYGFIDHKYMFGSFIDLYEYLWEVEDGKHREDLRWAMVYNAI